VLRSAGIGAVDGVPRRAARRRRGASTVTRGSGVAWVAGGCGDCAAPGAGAPAAITETAASAAKRARGGRADTGRPIRM
jgi:hypothetical protein